MTKYVSRIHSLVDNYFFEYFQLNKIKIPISNERVLYGSYNSYIITVTMVPSLLSFTAVLTDGGSRDLLARVLACSSRRRGFDSR